MISILFTPSWGEEDIALYSTEKLQMFWTYSISFQFYVQNDKFFLCEYDNILILTPYFHLYYFLIYSLSFYEEDFCVYHCIMWTNVFLVYNNILYTLLLKHQDNGTYFKLCNSTSHLYSFIFDF